MGLLRRLNVPHLYSHSSGEKLERLAAPRSRRLHCGAPHTRRGSFAKSARPPLKLSARSGAGQCDLLGELKASHASTTPTIKTKACFSQLDIEDITDHIVGKTCFTLLGEAWFWKLTEVGRLNWRQISNGQLDWCSVIL